MVRGFIRHSCYQIAGSFGLPAGCGAALCAAAGLSGRLQLCDPLIGDDRHVSCSAGRNCGVCQKSLAPAGRVLEGRCTACALHHQTMKPPRLQVRGSKLIL